jgi:hypothetical protein
MKEAKQISDPEQNHNRQEEFNIPSYLGPISATCCVISLIIHRMDTVNYFMR